MATQTRQELRDFLRSYDTNGSGSFNRDRWLHLCTSATINLPQESAAALFDKLDTDRDGLVTIDQLLQCLNDWQESVSSDVDSDVEETGRPVNLGKFADPNEVLMRDKRYGSLYESSPMEPDKEFGKSLAEATKLSQTISDSYPELAASFKHVMESFKRDILEKKYENANLEESYEREKRARKEDLARLEGELEAQIQTVESRLRAELSKKYEDAYLEKVRQKEIETRRFRETVNELREQVQTNNRKRSSLSGARSVANLATGEDNVFGYGGKKAGNKENQGSKEEGDSTEADLLREARDLRKKLKEAQTHLQESEAELAQLRATVETQSSQLYLEKMRASSIIEEKDILYSQIQKLRDALQEVQGKHALLLKNDFLDRAPDLQNQPWRRDSGQWSGSNEFSDRHLNPMDPDLASVGNWSAVDGLQSPDRIFRVVMAGESSVGKTCFMYRFCTGEFYHNMHATVGVDFKTKNTTVDNKVYTIEIWDTAGQERFHSMAKVYFRKCDGAILMYDVSNRESFNKVRDWVSMLVESCSDQYLPRAIVGNKIDLRDGEANAMKPPATSFVSTKEGENLAKLYNAEFMEISVLNSINVDDVITMLTRAMKYREDSQNSGIRIRAKSKNKLADCCK